MRLVSGISDRGDVSTQASNRVASSNSKARNANRQYYCGPYQAKTPSGLPSIDNLACLDPDFDYEPTPSLGQAVSKRHIGYRKNMESAGMSRALGGLGVNRYDSVSDVVRLARNQSNERGPCPKYLQKIPSIPSIITDAERKSMQYQQDLQRGLQQVYSHRRRI